MCDVTYKNYISAQLNKLENSEVNLTFENAKLKALIETSQHFRPIITYKCDEEFKSSILSDLLISVLEHYDNIKEALVKKELA